MLNPRLNYLLCLAVLIVYSNAMGTPRKRNVWHIYVSQDHRYGYQHTIVTELANGNFSYEIDSKILIDIFGEHKQQLSFHKEYTVTSTYEPISFSIEGEQGAGKVRAHGEVNDDKFVINFSRAGLEQKRILQLSPEITFDVCLNDLVNEHQKGIAKTITPTLISSEIFETIPCIVSCEESNDSWSSWSLKLDTHFMRGTILYQPDGTLLEAKYDIPKLKMILGTAKDANEINYLKLDNRDMLIFPINKDIKHPQRLKTLEVKLVWKGIPFEEFDFEDWRQEVMWKMQKNEIWETILEIKKPKIIRSRTAYPVKDKKYKPYLVETRYIKPNDPNICDVARKVTKGKKTALEAIEALSTWVFEYIEPVSIAETLSGPEVLKIKKGKCVEYSTLFASLARSIGIPTRIVLGEKMVLGRWVGHMWNEVYVGYWVPVDASTDNVGVSFSLLKLKHSNTLQGTQGLRWALTEDFDIYIEDFRIDPSLDVNDIEVGDEGLIYINKDFACRFKSPAKDWLINVESSSPNPLIRFIIPKERDDVYIYLVAFKVPKVVSPKTLIDTRLKIYKNKNQDFELLKNEVYETSTVKGHTSMFRRASTKNASQKVLATEIVWKQGQFSYLMNFFAEESIYKKYERDFFKLVSSFEYLAK